MRKYRPVLFYFILAVIFSAVLFILSALLIFKLAALPKGLITAILIGIPCVSVLFTSYRAAAAIRENGIVVGLLLASIYALSLFFLSFFTTGLMLSGAGLGRLCAIILCGAIGGIAGVNKKDKVIF